jgi:hypothetical protein
MPRWLRVLLGAGLALACVVFGTMGGCAVGMFAAFALDTSKSSLGQVAFAAGVTLGLGFGIFLAIKVARSL